MEDERIILKLSQFGFFALLIWLLTGITFSSCQKSQNTTDTLSTTNQNQTTTQTPATPAVYVTEYPTYKTSSESELERNRDTIASIRARLANAKAELKASAEREEEALTRENEELKARLDDYKDQGEEKWRQFRTDFDRAMDSLRTALKHLRTEVYIQQ